jgi:hypothetical protein
MACAAWVRCGALLFAVGAVVVGEWRQFMSTATSERSQVTIRLDAVTRAQLERDAAADRRPVSALARLILIDALRDRERQGGRVSRDALALAASGDSVAVCLRRPCLQPVSHVCCPFWTSRPSLSPRPRPTRPSACASGKRRTGTAIGHCAAYPSQPPWPALHCWRVSRSRIESLALRCRAHGCHIRTPTPFALYCFAELSIPFHVFLTK